MKFARLKEAKDGLIGLGTRAYCLSFIVARFSLLTSVT